MPRFLVPPVDWRAHLDRAAMNTPELYGRLDEMASITSIDGEYMAFDTFTHKMSNVGVARDEKPLFWARVKQKRATALRPLLTVDLTRNFGIAANTALSDLNALVAAGFLEKRKEGREWVYTATLSV